MLKFINENMCTEVCPCDENTFLKGYASVNRTDYIFNGRSPDHGPGTDADGKMRMFLVPTDADRKTYNTFSACWVNQLSGSTSTEFAAKFEPYLKVMQALEKNYNCSAACVPAFFWFTKSIDSYPSEKCINFILTEIGSGYMVPGAITIVCSILMLVIFIFQYTLWGKVPDNLNSVEPNK